MSQRSFSSDSEDAKSKHREEELMIPEEDNNQHAFRIVKHKSDRNNQVED
jgi:hypothetical protein